MKNFPFKILFLCVCLPPICYILTIQMIERYYQSHETERINQLLIQNHDALYEGRYTVKDEINKNIGEYLSHDLKYRLGVRINILVKTKDDRILYPTEFRKSLRDANDVGAFADGSLGSLNYVEVAAENYKVLNEGIIPTVKVEVRYNSWLSNGILVFYVLLSALILSTFIKRGVRETQARESEQRELVRRFSEQLKVAESRLEEVEAKESEYVRRITDLKQDKQSLSKDIDGLLEEMESLETGLDAQRSLKEEMELDVLQMKEELSRLKGKVEKPKKKKKVEATKKRFRVLYKNLVFTDRALEGFISLTEEFQLKAEEVIHRLNEDDALIPVKRKVFGKGGKMNVLEADFAYSGRIYFQKDSQPTIKVVTIGTKNTQNQDLAYVESVK